MSKLQGNCVVRGEFLDFHRNPPYDEKTLPYNKFIDRLAWLYLMLPEFYRHGLIRLYTSPSPYEELQGGTVLLLHVPPEERARIDEMVGGYFGIYIDWENDLDEFRAVRVEWVKKGLTSSKRITLDELIGSGKVLEPLCAGTIDLSEEGAFERYAERIRDSFYILRLTLHRKKSWFKERWTWTLGIEYITKEKKNN